MNISFKKSRPEKNFTNQTILSTCLALALFLVPSDALAKNHFVSHSGDNSSGSSWSEAWNELDQINWQKVEPGDKIIVEGGTYNTRLVVTQSGQPGNPIRIVQSKNKLRSGQIVISGANNPRPSSSGIPLHSQYANHPPGIEIDGSYIRIQGNRRCGIQVSDHAFIGILIKDDSRGVVLNNVEVKKNGLSIWHADWGGLIVNGGGHGFYNMNIHDNNGRNVIRNRKNARSYPSVFRACWIYNESNGFSDGIDFRSDNPQDQGDQATGLDRVSYCAIGPGLTNGMRFLGNSGGLAVRESLFLNGKQRNFSASSRNEKTRIILSNITSFTTPINPLGLRSRCERFYGTVGCYDIFYPQPNSRGNIAGGGSGEWYVRNSIFYGGSVNISAEKELKTKNNFQYNVQGNTTALASELVDPLFKADLKNMPNDVSFEKMARTNFSLQRNSKAQGAGSRYIKKAAILRCRR